MPIETASLSASPAATAGALPRRFHLVILFIALAALGLRGAYLWQQASNNPLVQHPVLDGAAHHLWAQEVAEGKPLKGSESKPYFRAPLYYHLLGYLYTITGPSLLAGRIAGIILGTLSVYLLGRLGAAAAGPAAGVVAALLAALYWPFIVFDAELLTPGLEVLLDISMLLTMLAAARRGSLRLFVLAGLLWGLSAITRPNVLAFVPGFLLWAWLVASKPAAAAQAKTPPGSIGPPAERAPAPAAARLSGGSRLRRFLAITACTGIAGAIVVLPVTVRNWVIGGEFVLVASQGGVNFFIGNNAGSDGYTAIVPGTRPDWWGGFEDTHTIAEKDLGHPPTEREVSSYWYGKSWEWIRSDPGAWAALMLKKFRMFWSPAEIPNNQPMQFFSRLSPVSAAFWVGFPVVGVLGLAGIAFWRRSPERGRPWLLLGLFGAIYMLTVVAFFTPERYRLPVVPVLIVSAAAGITGALGLSIGRTPARLAGFAAAALGASAFLYTNPPNREGLDRRARAHGHDLLANYYGAEPPAGPGDYGAAIEHFEQVLALDPKDFSERQKLIRIYQKAGRPEAALPHLDKVLEQNPHDVAALRAAVSMCEKIGRTDDAIRYQELLVTAMPDAPEPRVRLIPLLIAAGRMADVDTQQQALLKMAPSVQARNKVVADVGAMLYRGGRFAESAARYAELMRLNPNDVDAPIRQYAALRRIGRGHEAIPTLGEYADRFPKRTRLVNTLAWALATTPDDASRDGTRALSLARQIESLLPQATAESLDTLAAALAETGEFSEAVDTAGKAEALAKEKDKPDFAQRIEARRGLYASGKPYRDTGEPESEDPRN